MEAREKSHGNRKVFTTSVLITGILIIVYMLSQWIYTTVDATEERRFTLAPATKELLKNLDERIYISVLLDGKFPAGFKRLQESTEDILRRFAQVSPEITYNFENPNEGTIEEVNERRKQLASEGLIPTQLRITDNAGASSQYIYPFAIVHFGNRRISVSLLQDDIPGADKDVIINNSISLLEYKIADGIQKVRRSNQLIVAFTKGQGELTRLQTASIEKDLENSYAVNRIDMDSIVQIPPEIRIVIIAKPTQPFSEVQLFMLDQYIMNGGNVMFLIDPLNVSLDSIGQNKNYIPAPFNLGLDPLLFKFGARINPNLVLDLQSTKIPMVVGMQGDKVQTELFPWYYHPLISSTSDHPITKGLDRIQLEFPSSVDTVQTKSGVKKTILLRSSQYSRIQLTPVRLNFDILREAPDPKLFNKGPQNFAVMLEGSFESMFQNRLVAEQYEVLKQAGIEYKGQGEHAKILVVTDGDIIKNLVNNSTGETAPLGYNKYENMTFTGNRDFILNSLEYMLDESGVLEARSKDIKLRLLNTVKAGEEAVQWQLLNILGPLALIMFVGLAYQFFRKRKFGHIS
ncbi:MAG TPA: gliding motility-associated ABC transporter substrate-binding protein GldG [Saprospiraceae bacterium]|nr:gliding motility-associated ABC transporter substrate-binding protein GldG [Saprospiraceae bacterium]